jgi:hypothetical protein
MSLSKAATKLKAYLGIYKKTAAQYKAKLYTYSNNWFADTLNEPNARKNKKAPVKGLFGLALNELVQSGY